MECENSHLFTIPSIQPCLRLMLAETPFPHGSGASQEIVGTMSEDSVRVVTSPHILVGYCDGTAGLVRIPRQTINLATSCRSDTLSDLDITTRL